ncbi:PE family protein, partial [Mycobacterium sp. UM_CSW]|uniref:PE family protein n=1 Tax=Mycobacterium sp. UM_CSW TaxID=1370119 RepID=UPI0012693710
MSFVVAGPQAMLAGAGYMAGVGSAIRQANALAAAQTTAVEAAAADEISVAVAALFGSHGQGYQSVSAQMTALHDQFVQNLTAAGGAYASAEAANVQQTLLGLINAPTEALLGRPLIGNGADGGTVGGIGQPGGAGGLLFGNGGRGGDSTAPLATGGNGGPAGLIGNGGAGG